MASKKGFLSTSLLLVAIYILTTDSNGEFQFDLWAWVMGSLTGAFDFLAPYAAIVGVFLLLYQRVVGSNPLPIPDV